MKQTNQLPKYANKILYLAANKYTPERERVNNEKKNPTENVNGMRENGNRFTAVRALFAHHTLQRKYRKERKTNIYLIAIFELDLQPENNHPIT